MLDNETKLRLLSNWGEKANALDCYCEVKFIDTLSDWSCYIYAMNPDDRDEIACMIFSDGKVEVCDWCLRLVELTYNREGEYPIIDYSFRRIKASELLKKLEGKR